MRKIIRLNENDLHRIIKNSVNRILKENEVEEYNLRDFGKDALVAGGIGAATLGGNAYFHADDPDIDPEQARINQSIKDDLGQDVLKPQRNLPNDTISWERANRMENKINRAVSESIHKLLKQQL